MLSTILLAYERTWYSYPSAKSGFVGAAWNCFALHVEVVVEDLPMSWEKRVMFSLSSTAEMISICCGVPASLSSLI